MAVLLSFLFFSLPFVCAENFSIVYVRPVNLCFVTQCECAMVMIFVVLQFDVRKNTTATTEEVM